MIRAELMPLRSCPSCGADLELYSHPLHAGSYVPCAPCARLYRVTDTGTGLEPVPIDTVAPELAQAVRDLFAAYWSHLAA